MYKNVSCPQDSVCISKVFYVKGSDFLVVQHVHNVHVHVVKLTLSLHMCTFCFIGEPHPILYLIKPLLLCGGSYHCNQCIYIR